MSEIDRCLENNAGYAAGFSAGGLPRAPTRKIAIVACMDARLETGALLGLAEGEAHVIRNSGGVVTDDVIRSLIISQHFLGTREIMLIHHTDCGMMMLSDIELGDAIERDIGLRPPFPMEAFSNVDENLRESIARIEASPFVLHKHAIRAFVFDVETGALREVT